MSQIRDFLRALIRRLSEIDFVNEAMLFGAGLLISVIPFLILLSAFASERIDDDIALHLGLDHHAAKIVSHLFNNASPKVNAALILSALFVIAGTIAVVSSLLRIYEDVFKTEHRGGRDFVRVIACTAILCVAFGMLSFVGTALSHVPDGAFLIEIVMFTGVTLFVWWTMHFLLGGRVPWRTLWPSALATGIFTAVLSIFSKLYFSSSIISDDKTYGPIGAVFSLTTWLIAIGAVVLLGAVAGPAWHDARGRQDQTAS
jgi:membrane protein